MTTTVIDDIGLLVTNDPVLGPGELGLLTGASVVFEEETVISVGPRGQIADERIDAA
ncbi:MAG TPA: imidazolonepropionase, partial [Acidimicrobiales bacterium]|nr:imidazolonepropionase [Acidimicrobiales bacterium]